MVLAAVLLSGVSIARGAIQLNDRGRPFSCPDPSIADVPQFARSGDRYTEACTTDYDANAYALYRSNDLRTGWHLFADVFPTGHQPWWALPPGGSAGGRYWAPEIHWLDHLWVVYFAALPRPTLRLPGGMVIGVAWARSLSGPWRTKILHWRGQFNYLKGDQETYGGVIDPTETENPQTKQRYLYWAEQHYSIWGARLSPDGLSIVPGVHLVLWAKEPHDCDTPDPSSCTIEGPAAFYKKVGGVEWPYLLYSARSTWTGTYDMWASVSRRALGTFTRLGRAPILRSGNGWWGPGGGSHPVPAPDGRSWWLPFHATPVRNNSGHLSWLRLGFIGRVRWLPGPKSLAAHNAPPPPIPLVNGGVAG